MLPHSNSTDYSNGLGRTRNKNNKEIGELPHALLNKNQVYCGRVLVRKETATQTMSKTVTDFRTCAQLVFNKINDGWGDWTTNNFNFWRVGNAFDTLIDYFVNVDASNVSLAASALQLFDGGKGGDWFDDFGWWGIAFLRAARRASLLCVNPLTCLYGSTICWQKMDDNAPLVWAKADQQTFRQAKPRFAGGCWNNNFSSVCNPFVERLCGFQNTVTNGLYQVLAARSFQWWHTLPYLDAAKREYNWLGQWFFHPDLTADEDLLFTDTSGRMLVRERVSTYDVYNGSYPKVAYYEPKLHWAGDQGLILSAMVDLAPITPVGPRDILYNIARGILDGVRGLLVDSQGILQPWSQQEKIFRAIIPIMQPVWAFTCVTFCMLSRKISP